MSAVKTAGETMLAVETAGETAAEPTMAAMSERIEERLQEMSDRLKFIEKRSMQLNLLAHEVVRMMSGAIDEFLPLSDCGWLLRRTFLH